MSNLENTTIQIINWEKFDPRKDVKSSSWIRVEVNTFGSREFHGLRPSDRAFWLYLISTAAIEHQTLFEIDREHARDVGLFTDAEIDQAIEKLALKGHIKLVDNHHQRVSTYANVPTNERTKERYIGPNTQMDDHADHPTHKIHFNFNPEELYKEYPKRNGNTRKGVGLERLKKIIKTQEAYDQMKLAIINYRAYCEREGKVGTEYVLQFATFVNRDWKDWLEVTPEPEIKRYKTLAELEAL